MVDIFRRISDHLLFTIYESELRLKTAVIGSDKLPLWIPPVYSNYCRAIASKTSKS